MNMNVAWSYSRKELGGYNIQEQLTKDGGGATMAASSESVTYQSRSNVTRFPAMAAVSRAHLKRQGGQQAEGLHSINWSMHQPARRR